MIHLPMTSGQMRFAFGEPFEVLPAVETPVISNGAKRNENGAALAEGKSRHLFTI